MARIAGVELPQNKRMEIALTYVYGIGLTTSNLILEEAKIDPNLRSNDVTDEQVAIIVKLKHEGEKIARIARAVNLSRLTIYRVLARYGSV